MEVLVLGGGNFVGRAVVEQALARGDRVTTVNRGRSARLPGVRSRHADRLVPGALAECLPTNETWDAVIDTWSGAPMVVRESARLLADRAEHYGYVSSRSVYRWPPPRGRDESAPVVDADPGISEGDYATVKRGGELAVIESFPGRALLARAGLILGPHEDIGRLPWWLDRISRGGLVPAPGPVGFELQYVDARDLARWMLGAAERRLSGVFNVTGERGHASIGQLLQTCREVTGSAAELAWLTPDRLLAAGVTGWNDLPIWVPPDSELAGLHDSDVSAAHAAGLTCRPVRDTVADTWAWVQREGRPAGRPDRAPLGLSADVERALLDELRGSG